MVNGPRALYVIENTIAKIIDEHVDHDTGELSIDGVIQLEAMEIDKDEAFLAMASLVKDYRAHAEAIAGVIEERKQAKGEALLRAEVIESFIQERAEKGRKIQDGNATIEWRRNPGKLVNVNDEAAMRAGYKIQPERPPTPPPVVDKKRLLADLRGEWKLTEGEPELLVKDFATLAKPVEVKVK